MFNTYTTLNGESNPYKVLITSGNTKNLNHVAVMCMGKTNYDILTTTFTATKVFVGKSPKCESGSHASRHDGNTILLHLKHDMYVFIGKEITKFRAFAEIKAFVSPINSEKVPFPYAVDSKNNTYLFNEGVVLMNLSSKDYINPYDYYEDYRIVIPDKKSKKPKHQISISLDDDEKPQEVLEIYVEDEQQYLRYEPNSVEQFNRMTEGKKTMYIVFANEPKRMVSIDGDDLKKLMTLFGTMAKFRPLKKAISIKNSIQVSEES